MRLIKTFIIICFLVLPSQVLAGKPKLVLQITVDGLRGDLLHRYGKNFGKGGFDYLLENGAVFSSAHYLHANTETVVGHTSLATGATPSVHGMVGNVWYNADTGQLGYNIEDPEAPLLPTRTSSTEGAQIDPAQLRAGTSGRSPRGILAPTIADTMLVSIPGTPRVFGVSSKDRSAVAMAGHGGIAYWYSTDTGDFQTSSYYMEAYPQWVKDWNQKRPAEAFGGEQWRLLLDKQDYTLGAQDDRSYEVDLKGFGRTFPHNYGEPSHPLFFTRVLVSPAGDKLLANFAKTLIDEEDIGQSSTTDYLSVSFSGVDAVNHFFGPSSLENEDTVLQLDRTLADLLRHIDRRVGLEHTLIVLSADHGMPEMPEYATEKGLPADRLYASQVLDIARDYAQKTYGDALLVQDFFRPYLYLDPNRLQQHKLDRAEVNEALAQVLGEIEGVRAAIPSKLARSMGESAIAYNHHPRRSGDLYIYPEPYWFLHEKGAVGVMHGSPWKYDQHVPIIFVGQRIKPGTYSRMVHPIDVAPTLAALLGISAPAAAQGSVLREVTER